MKPAEFIVFAGRVVSLGPAGARSAISRAYYGAFHVALEVLRELVGEGPGGPKAHVLVPQFLASSHDQDAMLASSLLSDLLGARIRADYRLSNSSVERMILAMDKVESARAVESKLASFAERCRQEPAAIQRLREGIERVKAIHK